MGTAFLIQTAASLVAISLMVALAAWAKIARPQPPLDETRARALFADDFPDRSLDAVWISTDGAGAIARSGAAALVLVRIGDGYAVRQVPWSRAATAAVGDGRLSLDLGDVAAPRAVLRLSDWPPEERAA